MVVVDQDVAGASAVGPGHRRRAGEVDQIFMHEACMRFMSLGTRLMSMRKR